MSAPDRRRLAAFAFDPMTSRLSGRRLEIDIRYEPLAPGPIGELVHVVDFDGTRGVWYQPVDLDDPSILARGGLRPTEGDPRTHQQVVYAVSMSVIERFERFLGRRFRWRADRALIVVPHAFEGRNAFFDPDRRAILFGYYRADERDPGANLPGQVMFTCLSADIIAHELTHALVHRLRPHFSVPTNPDVFAWHEACADLVALFQHFAFPQVVADAVARARGDLRENHGLMDLAQEFGVSTGRGTTLRSALGSEATPACFRAATEPHERGACFVAGIFDAYLIVYQKAIADLLRIATGGTGELPPGSLHPDLVARVAAEAVKNADRFLGMVVRAFDFLPVVDVTFGDVVRAIVTADRALYPNDECQLRATLVEALRRRGIYPARISSLADEALAWPAPPVPLTLTRTRKPHIDLAGVILSATRDLDPEGRAGDVRTGDDGEARPNGRNGNSGAGLEAWAEDHALALSLDPTVPIALGGLHVVYRRAADRQPRPEIVIQFLQRRADLEDDRVPEPLRLLARAGTTVIASVDGTVNHVVSKPLPLSDPSILDTVADPVVADAGRLCHRLGTERWAAIQSWVDGLELTDPLAAWTEEPAISRLTFARLHAASTVVAGP